MSLKGKTNCRRTAVALLAHCTLGFAENGKLTGVSPFAVHAGMDGAISNHDKAEKLIVEATYRALNKAQIPTAEPKSLEQETSPFLHWQLDARQLEGNGGILYIARLAIKVKTTNPYNGSVMHGTLTSGFDIGMATNTQEMAAKFTEYMNKTMGVFLTAWLDQNPIPNAVAPAHDGALVGVKPVTIYTNFEGVTNKDEVGSEIVKEGLALLRKNGVPCSEPMGRDKETNAFLYFDIRFKVHEQQRIAFFDFQVRSPATHRHNDVLVSASLMRSTDFGFVEKEHRQKEMNVFINSALLTFVERWHEQNPPNNFQLPKDVPEKADNK